MIATRSSSSVVPVARPVQVRRVVRSNRVPNLRRRNHVCPGKSGRRSSPLRDRAAPAPPGVAASTAAVSGDGGNRQHEAGHQQTNFTRPTPSIRPPHRHGRLKLAFACKLRDLRKDGDSKHRGLSRQLEAVNQRDAEGMVACLEPDAEFVPIMAALEGRVYRGEEGVREWIAEMARPLGVLRDLSRALPRPRRPRPRLRALACARTRERRGGRGSARDLARALARRKDRQVAHVHGSRRGARGRGRDRGRAHGFGRHGTLKRSRTFPRSSIARPRKTWCETVIRRR